MRGGCGMFLFQAVQRLSISIFKSIRISYGPINIERIWNFCRFQDILYKGHCASITFTWTLLYMIFPLCHPTADLHDGIDSLVTLAVLLSMRTILDINTDFTPN